MKQTIQKLCKKLEKENKIKILFAIENGSRAWRMESADSDYDVRFVYVRPLKEYIQIKKPIDVIQASFDITGKPCKPEGAMIDMSGFDVFKFCELLSSSNPTTIEWLMTDIVYYGEQNKIFREYALKKFNPKALYFHYKSMCRFNYQKYLSSKALVTYKKYLYAYRGLINAKWVVHKRTIPPIIFARAFDELQANIPSNIIVKLKQIIALKSSGNEKDIIKNIANMDLYIEEFLKYDDTFPVEQSEKHLDFLNKEIQKILLKTKHL